jgi:predicted kinase
MSGVAECVILIGLPASGKSSFYRERFAATHDHVSKDMMRHNLRPQRRQEQLVAAALAEGRSVVVDNTNPAAAVRVVDNTNAAAAVRAPLIALAHANGADVVGYFFKTEAADALRRNRAREGSQRVPDVAIFATRKKLQPPVLEEGFDRLFEVTLDEPNRRFEVRPLTSTT